MKVTTGLLLLLLLLLSCITTGQPSSFHGWIVSSHEQQLGPRWKVLTDIQLRSSERWKHSEVVLLRPGVSYAITKNTSTTLGYAYIANWDEEDGKRSFYLEHRAWEQLLITKKIGRTELANRLRLEQRFLEDASEFALAQRIRYYIRYEVPISKNESENKGAFAVLQNELFLNIQNKQIVNNQTFDQNRAYTGLGFHCSKAVDIEAGYLYRYQLLKHGVHHHIIQLTLATTL